MLLKLYKSQRLNEIIAQSPLLYVEITEILDMNGRSIVTGSAYHTHAMLILIHKIMGPSLQVNFYKSTEKDLEIGIFLRAADIKSLYTNISRDL